jgi:hypothetical protein
MNSVFNHYGSTLLLLDNFLLSILPIILTITCIVISCKLIELCSQLLSSLKWFGNSLLTVLPPFLGNC